MRGSHERKVNKGKLVKVSAEFGETYENVSITGDFFIQPPNAVRRLERAIEGAPVSETVMELTDRLEDVEADLIGFDRDHVAEAARESVRADWQIIDGSKYSEPMQHGLDEVLSRKMENGELKPTIRFWHRKNVAVPFGRYQSYQDEVQEEYIQENDIEVVRRITGGGAMYAEPGRVITYSMYLPEDMVPQDFEESYRQLDAWAVDALREIGVNAEYEPINDIVTEEGKLGGAAQLRSNGAVLHHTMISHSMNTENMLKALRIGKEKISDKTIDSAEKRVSTIDKQVSMDREEVIEKMKSEFRKRFGGSPAQIGETTLQEARQLADSKFSSDDWNRKL